MRELIERLEKATEGSLELDKAILLSFGFTWRGMNYWHHDNSTMWRGPTFFTRSLDAAVALVERVLPGAEWEVSNTGRRPGATVISYERRKREGAYASTPAIALCIAILRAAEESAG